MRIYSIGAFFKILLGIGILSLLYNYVNVYQNPSLGLGFGFLGTFLLIRGVSYFFFLILRKIFSNYEDHIKSSASYKLSLLLGVFCMVNLTLMIINNRSQTIGIALICLFLIIQYLITADFRKQYTQ